MSLDMFKHAVMSMYLSYVLTLFSAIFLWCFWQGTLAMGLALKMTWVLERRVSGTAVRGWNQCRRTMWCDLRIGWRGNFIKNQGHLWVERIVWFSCCLFVLIWDKHQKCSRFRNVSSPAYYDFGQYFYGGWGDSIKVP